MSKHSITFRLLSSYVIATFLAILLASLYLFAQNRMLVRESIAEELIQQGERFAEYYRPAFMDAQSGMDLSEECRQFSRITGLNLALLSSKGFLLGASAPDASYEDALKKQEVRSALAGFKPVSNYSLANGKLSLAVPVYFEDQFVGVIWLSTDDPMIDSYYSFIFGLVISGLIIFLIIFVTTIYHVRRIRKWFSDLIYGVKKMLAGESGYHIYISAVTETIALTVQLNMIAEKLDEQMKTIARQERERNALFSSMVEGVIAVDNDEKIISVNPAAVSCFGLATDRITGRLLQESIRNSDLQKLVFKTLVTQKATESEISLYDGQERFLQAHCSLLMDVEGNRLGAIVVLNDITRFRQFENMRRDFVSNVSHELRTPITAIKGFVETLRQDAIRTPEEADHFLEIIGRQTERMSAIVEDLLSLASVEHVSENRTIEFTNERVIEVLESTRVAIEHKASAKRNRINIVCEEAIEVVINRQMMEQAIINLLDNAIKFSPEDKSIELIAEQDEWEIRIIVRDNGIGIAKKHLPRLTERFYRVDKARSRKQGGTGLGLAIVKHIVNAHGGELTIESMEGKGSTFTIHLPIQTVTKRT